MSQFYRKLIVNIPRYLHDYFLIVIPDKDDGRHVIKTVMYTKGTTIGIYTF